ERAPGRLRVEAQAERLLLLRAVAIPEPPRPDAPSGAVLRDLLEEVDVRVEEEREALREVVDVQPPLLAELHIAEPIGEREGQFLLRGRAGLADVIAGDADRVELRHLLRAERDEVADQPKVRARREDPLLLRDVFLQDVG